MFLILLLIFKFDDVIHRNASCPLWVQSTGHWCILLKTASIWLLVFFVISWTSSRNASDLEHINAHVASLWWHHNAWFVPRTGFGFVVFCYSLLPAVLPISLRVTSLSCQLQCLVLQTKQTNSNKNCVHTLCAIHKKLVYLCWSSQIPFRWYLIFEQNEVDQ